MIESILIIWNALMLLITITKIKLKKEFFPMKTILALAVRILFIIIWTVIITLMLI